MKTMTDHKIGPRKEWLAAREQLLLREKEHTKLGDELAQQSIVFEIQGIDREINLGFRTWRAFLKTAAATSAAAAFSVGIGLTRHTGGGYLISR